MTKTAHLQKKSPEELEAKKYRKCFPLKNVMEPKSYINFFSICQHIFENCEETLYLCLYNLWHIWYIKNKSHSFCIKLWFWLVDLVTPSKILKAQSYNLWTMLPYKFDGSASREVTLKYPGVQSSHTFLGLGQIEWQVREETRESIRH